MAIKILALDIDGTLTSDSDNTISPGNLSAIRAAREAGVFVTIATGRPTFSTRTFWRQMELSGPSIQFGGALTVEAPSGACLEACPLQPEMVCSVLTFAHEIGVDAQIYVGDMLITERENPFTERYSSKSGITVHVDPDIRFKRFEGVPKILAFSKPEDEPQMREKFVEHLGNQVHIARSQSTFIEINDRCATKGRALERLANRMGVAQSEVAAMGDSYLDIDMIQWAGTGVGMEGSVDEVIRACDVIAPACKDDGVAGFIKRYILK